MRNYIKVLAGFALAAVLLVPVTASAAENYQTEVGVLDQIIQLLEQQIALLQQEITLQGAQPVVPTGTSPVNTPTLPIQIPVQLPAQTVSSAPAPDTTSPVVWGGSMSNNGQSIHLITNEALDVPATSIVWLDTNGGAYDTQSPLDVTSPSSSNTGCVYSYPIGAPPIKNCGGFAVSITFGGAATPPQFGNTLPSGNTASGVAQVWIYDTAGNRTVLPWGTSGSYTPSGSSYFLSN